MNHLTEEQFVLYYYGEGDGSPAVREHLDACESCRADYEGLQRVLNVVDSAPVPERGAGLRRAGVEPAATGPAPG